MIKSRQLTIIPKVNSMVRLIFVWQSTCAGHVWRKKAKNKPMLKLLQAGVRKWLNKAICLTTISKRLLLRVLKIIPLCTHKVPNNCKMWQIVIDISSENRQGIRLREFWHVLWQQVASNKVTLCNYSLMPHFPLNSCMALAILPRSCEKITNTDIRQNYAQTSLYTKKICVPTRECREGLKHCNSTIFIYSQICLALSLNS
jgi:hypothetical protein